MDPSTRVVITQFGENPLHAVDNHLELQPQSAPDTATLKPTDVIVTVRSASVGWVDLLMTSGQYQHMPAPPYCPGLEYSGVVAWAGAGVDPDRLAVGDEVFADGLLTGPRSIGDYQQYGGFAGYAVAPREALRRIPAGMNFDQACNLLGNYETAYHCLIKRGQLSSKDTVLIHGASGATGLAAVHVAKLVGATVIATGRSRDKLEVVQSQGADHVVAIGNEDGSPGVRRFRDDIKSLTQGRGANVVYDGVGGDISLETLRCVEFGARYLVVGWAATPFVAKGKGQRGAPNANQLPTNLIMMKGLDVLGCPTAITTHRDPSIRKERLAAIMGWVEAGQVSPYVAASFPLSDVKEAMRAKWRSAFVGGCALHPWE